MARYGEDIDLRKDYARRHKQCQLSSLLFSHGLVRSAVAPATETHHIWGGVARVDNWSNLIRLCNEAHLWCHENGDRAKVACMYQKIAVSRLWLPEIEEACRTHTVAGWLEALLERDRDILTQWCGKPVLRHLQRQTPDKSTGVTDDRTAHADSSRQHRR